MWPPTHSKPNVMLEKINNKLLPWQILSRVKPAVGGETPTSLSEKKKKNKTKVPRLEEYLQQRDYLGALTLLEVLTHIT